MHHLPGGTHSLAPRPGSLDRLTFQIGPRGRTCTCNLSVLSGTPLHWATRGGAHGRICTGTVRVLSAPSLHWTTWAKWCRVRDFHPNLSGLSGAPLVVGLTRHELAHPAGLPPADSPFEAEDDCNFTTDAEMVGRLGFEPSSRRLRAGTSLSKFATQKKATRRRIPLAGRRSQACDGPDRHRYSRRVKWSAVLAHGHHG